MKRQMTKICVPLVIMMVAAFLGAFPSTYAAQPTAQDQVTAFIENVLPVDTSKYVITLKDQANAGTTDMFIYTLDSDESKLAVVCDVEKNIVSYCHVYAEKGQVISDKQHANLIDAVKSFLEGYQTYTKIDSANLIDMLAKIDSTKNSTVTLGNTKLTLTNFNSLGTEISLFKWAYTVNGAEYTSLQVGFQKNGIFDSLLDNRALFSIGDTTVNISREQAIGIAIKYSETYSYALPDGSHVTGFNINEDRTKTEILTTGRNTTVLRPYWFVKLYLDQTYLGNVKGLAVFIWANSGEVFDCGNIASGGAEYKEIDTTSLSSSSTDNTAAIVAVAAIVVAITACTLFIKKKRE
jgi:hypothetical protein